MLVLCCNIKIRDISFQAVHEVVVKRSMHSHVDTALIKLPASARLNLDGKRTESVEVAKVFQQGDAVQIQLGYNGNLTTEFTGFISRVDFAMPVVIECEGYSWQLRKVVFEKGKTWKNPTVKTILEDCIAGTDIKLSKDMPSTVLTGKIIVYPGATALDAITELKKYVSGVYFIGNVLYCGLEYTAQLNESVTYRLGWNTIKDDNLKYRRPEDARVQVSVLYKDKSGKEHHKVVGKAGGIMIQKRMGHVTDTKQIDLAAKADAAKHRVAGYEGKITAFLEPYAGHGWKAVIKDDKYPDRAGTYMLACTEIRFGMNGARRICEITKNLSASDD